MNLLDVILVAGIACLFFNPILGGLMIIGSLILADQS